MGRAAILPDLKLPLFFHLLNSPYPVANATRSTSVQVPCVDTRRENGTPAPRLRLPSSVTAWGLEDLVSNPRDRIAFRAQALSIIEKASAHTLSENMIALRKVDL
jgi:hypothetical protein